LAGAVVVLVLVAIVHTMPEREGKRHRASCLKLLLGQRQRD
jgi:hypothetical protein